MLFLFFYVYCLWFCFSHANMDHSFRFQKICLARCYSERYAPCILYYCMIHVIIVELVIGKPALKFIIDEFVKLPEAFHIDILFWIWKISAVFTSIPMYKVMPPFKSVRKLYRLEDRIYNRSIRRRSVGHRASSQRVIKPWDVDCKYFMMEWDKANWRASKSAGTSHHFIHMPFGMYSCKSVQEFSFRSIRY